MRERAAARLLQIKENKMIMALWDFFAPVRENPFPLQVLFTALYRLVLDGIYLFLISPRYNYAGFTATVFPLRMAPSASTMRRFSSPDPGLHQFSSRRCLREKG